MSEEKQRILKMLEDGKLTAGQAMALLETLEPGDGTKGPGQPKQSVEELLKDDDGLMANPFPGERLLLIRVLSAEGDKVRVNLPLNLVKGIIKATGKMPYINSEMEGINLNEMMDTVVAAIDQDISGRFVDVETGNGDKVVIEIV